ncbi:MAG TPA: ABC transporter permease [Deinococcales bacterium]|nr:ABC transporter permease [Deinococcales bacterium]
MATATPALTARPRRADTPLYLAWRRFRRSGPGKLGAVITVIAVVMALLAPVIKPYDPYADRSYINRLKPPSITHVFGTDNLGRDVATRVLHGARVSLRVGFLAVAFAALVGSALGLIAGYFGGYFDILVGWVTDILLAFPGTLLAIAIVAVRGPGLDNTILAIGIVQIPRYIRIARAAVLGLRDLDFTHAAEALGASRWRILGRHLLPNSISPLIVQASLSIATATLEAAALGFLGLGAQPPTPEWGTMIADAFRSGYWQSAPWTAVFPGLAILVSVIGYNLLGDGLRDVLDPRALK